MRRVGKSFLILLALGWLLVPKPPLLDGLSFSQAVYDRAGHLLRLTTSSDQKFRLRLRLEEMSPLLVEAALLQEDSYFYWHPGINPFSIIRAFTHTYLRLGPRLGGSTITMQLARIRYHLTSRTLPGKLRQMLLALQIERRYSKREILEAYLNLAPYGGNVEGVGAASLVYFRRDASRLTLGQALALTVIPQRPAFRTPGPRTDNLAEARDRLFNRWVRRHPEAVASRSEIQLPTHLQLKASLPFLAPHWVDARIKINPGRSLVASTLDLGLQHTLERQLSAYVSSQKGNGIRNATAMLLDYRSMEVQALVGSANFFDESIQGQVDGTEGRRSPGSTLKPFLYGMAIDQGIVHPLSMLKDAPTSFADYDPENFDRDFAGPISVTDALIRSRNVPAVQLAGKLHPSLYSLLKSAGVSPLRSEGYYGLAVALGGVEMSMRELVSLYAMLANGGWLKPLRFQPDDPAPSGTVLLSPEAAFLVLEMLKENPRPGQGFRNEWIRGGIPVAWKTGTSFGFRDAWSIGVFGPYVLAVWVGNFNGEGNPAFIGREAAAPLFFQMVDAIRSQQEGRGSWIPRWQIADAKKLTRIKVCAVSGQLPGPFCRHLKETWFIPGKSPIKSCEIHRSILVDTRTGLRTCASLASPGTTRTEVVEFWPSDLLKLFRRAGIPRRVPPPDDPRCRLDEKSHKGVAPEITSPRRQMGYSVRAGRLEASRIPLTAVADADVRELYWFVDEHFVGKSNVAESFFWQPHPGQFTVRVVDDQGRSDAREVRVSVVE